MSARSHAIWLGSMRLEAWLRRLASTRWVMAGAACLLFGGGCQAHPAAPGDTRSCGQRQAELVQVLQKTPETGLAAAIDVGLAASPLTGTFGAGPILQLAADKMILDGASVPGPTLAARTGALVTRLADRTADAPLYIAAAWDLDMEILSDVLRAVPTNYDLRLVFAAPTLMTDPDSDDPDSDDPDSEAPDAHSTHYSTRVLKERDAARRNAIASDGYEEYSSCKAVDEAVQSVQTLGVRERWPQLRASMLNAVGKCECGDIDADGLRNLLLAEQRAGSVALSSVPVAFLRDTRCAASMAGRTVQRLLDDIGEFDAEFSGNWKEDTLVFDRVVTNDRLLVYLCVALPDETLAWLQGRNGTVYFRAAGESKCQGWQFSPLAPGAPMGTWQRTDPGAELAVHYRMGAGELRLFGPATPGKSKPSDSGPWSCDEDVVLTAVDDTFVNLEGGARWYFGRAPCEQAPASSQRFAGCVGEMAAGRMPAAPREPSEAEETTDVSPPSGSSALE